MKKEKKKGEESGMEKGTGYERGIKQRKGKGGGKDKGDGMGIEKRNQEGKEK